MSVIDLKPCRWTFMLTCDQGRPEVNSHCLGCCIAYLQRSMVDEDLVTAGEHLVVLGQILQAMQVLTVKDLECLVRPQRIPSLSR